MHKQFFPILHHLSPVIHANTTGAAFALLCNSRFNIHFYTQCEATSTWKLAAATFHDFLCERLQRTFTCANWLHWTAQFIQQLAGKRGAKHTANRERWWKLTTTTTVKMTGYASAHISRGNFPVLVFWLTWLPACFQLQPDQVVFETFINSEGKEFICAYRAGKRYYLDSWHSQVRKHLFKTVIIRILEICKVPVAQSIE